MPAKLLVAAGAVAVIAGGVLYAYDEDVNPLGPQKPTYYPADFATADAKAGFTATNSRPREWTWHHHEGTRMILVPRDLHAALTHLGPAAHYRGVTGVKDAYR